MKTISLQGDPESNAYAILTRHLENRGHEVTWNGRLPHDVTVCWGRSWHEGLNHRVNEFDKFEAFAAFDKLNILHPEVLALRYNDNILAKEHFPVLARKRHHARGKDIVVCRNQGELAHVVGLGEHDFLSKWIPTETEYRAWTFQNRILAVYEKVYKGVGEFHGYRRNHRFGFAFEKRDDLRKDAMLQPLCVNAVKALNLDFGAVDVIKGKDGKLYVLEVNSMPAIEGPERVSGIRLARAISKWAEAQR